MKYYYLAASLPPLKIGHPPEITSQDLYFALKTNLTEADYAKVVVMRRYYDFQNIRDFWNRKNFDHHGNLNENELEDALVNGEGFPGYLYDFLNKYETLAERVLHFSALIEAYYQYEIEKAEGFLKDYLIFEREWRLVLTGFRAKLLGKDIARELQFEDPYDETTAQILAQKDAKTYEPPSRYSNLKIIFEEKRSSPLELHKALCEYRFEKLESMYGIDVFSIDRILAYMAQLVLVEKWLELDKNKGMQIVEGIIKEL